MAARSGARPHRRDGLGPYDTDRFPDSGAASRRKRSASQQRRDVLRAQKHNQEQIALNVRKRQEAWSERNDLARRHMDVRVVSEDELRAMDRTRPARVERFTEEIRDAYTKLQGARR